ncbi:MAG: hypothetical protein ACXV5K_07650 [Halobacteriota archaeon]
MIRRQHRIQFAKERWARPYSSRDLRPVKTEVLGYAASFSGSSVVSSEASVEATTTKNASAPL